MLPRFQFQGAVGSHFKALVVHGIGVDIVGVFVCRRQLADFCTVFAFYHLVLAQGDVGRRVVGAVRSRYFRRRYAADVFVVSGVVFIGGARGDFVPGVVAGELVGRPCLSANRLPIA